MTPALRYAGRAGTQAAPGERAPTAPEGRG